MKWLFLFMMSVSMARGEELFCRDLVQSICGQRTPDYMVKTLEKNIQTTFMMATNSQHASPQMIKSAGLSAWMYAENAVYGELKISKSDLVAVFGEVKSDLLSLLKTHSHIPESIRAGMLRQIEQTEIILEVKGIMDWLKAAGMSEDAAFAASARFCGVTGMGRNGYNSWIVKNGIYSSKVYVCPGWLAWMIDRHMTRTEALNALVTVLGHELGHSIGPRYVLGLYDKLGECWNKERPQAPFHSYGGEVVADFWASELLSRRLSKQALRGQTLLTELTHGMNFFCGGSAGGSHPGGFDRLEIMFTRRSDFRQSLGCEKKISCDLQGSQQ